MTAPTVRGELLTSISNALVHLHKEYYGKGPTKTKTFIVDDTVLCILRGGFSQVHTDPEVSVEIFVLEPGAAGEATVFGHEDGAREADIEEAVT